MNHYDHMSVMINFLTLKLKIHTASNSEIESCTEKFVKNIECLVNKDIAVYINRYVCMIAMVSFWPLNLNIHIAPISEIEGRKESFVKYRKVCSKK